jgi:hypothetical protein
MSELKVNKVTPRSGTTVTLGDSGDTITIPSGATITNNGTATGFGKVLQVVSATKDDSFSTTSTSFVSTSFSVSITPSSASNKILLQLCGQFDTDTVASGNGLHATIVRGATDIGTAAGIYSLRTITARNLITGVLIAYDSPNTTSSTTYTLHIRAQSVGTINFNNLSLRSTFIAMEIAG